MERGAVRCECGEKITKRRRDVELLLEGRAGGNLLKSRK